ncbi:hypothetical protein GF371_02750 [Candidatus Woesearchaeota archaeon]|nr:hypothetical protein [Candidatus Woesearchaeota archaeon]
MRELRLPGPRKEIISDNLANIDLDDLFDGADKGATILVFDYSERINQVPLFEKDVRRYRINKDEYFDVLDELVTGLERKHVKRENMVFLTHQTYTAEDIAYSGRAAIHVEYGFGFLIIEAVASLRKGSSEFNPDFAYRCPVYSDRIFRSRGEFWKRDIELPNTLVSKIIRDIYRISGNPNIDFEVYADNNQLFYHDMFLAYK